MTVPGVANRRMKDFYDVWVLILNFQFAGETVQRALEKTFRNRETELPDETHVIFSKEFAESKAEQWRAFAKKIREDNVIEMTKVIKSIREFFVPILDASQQGSSYMKKWKRKWL